MHVAGFLPYFWVAAPKDFTNADCAPLMEHLNVSQTPFRPCGTCGLSLIERQTTVFSGARPVSSITIANKRSLWGYKGDAVSPFIKITVADLKSYPKVRGAFERGEVSFRNYFEGKAVMTFESNIAYTLRFMIDHQVRETLVQHVGVCLDSLHDRLLV